MFLNSWNSNQGSMKRLSFLSTISIVFLQIEENLLKKYQCTVLKRVSSILRINIEIVLRKDRRFILPWLLFCKFIFPSVMILDRLITPLSARWSALWTKSPLPHVAHNIQILYEKFLLPLEFDINCFALVCASHQHELKWDWVEVCPFCVCWFVFYLYEVDT